MNFGPQFGEDIPTIHEVIGAHTLDFRQKFKLLQLNIFPGTPVLVWVH